MNGSELLKGLNEKQQEAVIYTEGPLLILAGAGSGKTRVLTHRMGYLIANGVNPWNICGITFTNKAAKEMRERVDRLLGGSGSEVFVSTFHSMCVRLLRPDIEKLGYGREFNIYDTDDCRTLIRQIIKDLNMDSKMFRDRGVLSGISAAKNAMRTPQNMENEAGDFYERKLAVIYLEYQRRLKNNNALDFDDLLLLTVKLFTDWPEVLEKWHRRFQYIMVDEYQDTNHVQFEIVRLLAGEKRNVCVVGDDDQSIYKFRGADISNILDFEKNFPGAKTVKLEQNYRSTKAILNAANEVIRNNKGRKQKRLWTDNEEGSLPIFTEYSTAAAEAEAVVKSAASCGISLKEQAVLYRTNAQSRLLEEKCVAKGLPYTIVGGVNFYQRKEIKDMLAYMRLAACPWDDLDCARILNVPRRGIGDTTLNKVSVYAADHMISLYEALLCAGSIEDINKGTAEKIRKFTDYIESLKTRYGGENADLKAMLESIRDDTGYRTEIEREDPVEAETRLQNIDELISKAVDYMESRRVPDREGDLTKVPGTGAHFGPEEEENSGDGKFSFHPEEGFIPEEGFEPEDGFEPDEFSDRPVNEAEMPDDGFEPVGESSGLWGFLEDVSLVADIDRMDENAEKLTLMTMHAAKGLEFDRVYLCGMEDGLFPSYSSINAYEPEKEIEEERRLCYVGITRARKELFLSSAKERMINGETRYQRPSRFIDELPEDAAEKHMSGRKTYDRGNRDDFDGAGSFASGVFSGGSGYGSLEYNTGAGRNGASERLSGNAFASRFGGFGSLDTTAKGTKTTGAGSGVSQLNKGLVKEKPAYGEGDRVRHVKFGDGTVRSVTDSPRDYEVVVDFDGAGQKKMFAGFAKLEKL